jgi:hypothetical protein
MDVLSDAEREQMHRVIGMLEAEGLNAASRQMRVFVRALAGECLGIVRESEREREPEQRPAVLPVLHRAHRVLQPIVP